MGITQCLIIPLYARCQAHLPTRAGGITLSGTEPPKVLSISSTFTVNARFYP